MTKKGLLENRVAWRLVVMYQRGMLNTRFMAEEIIHKWKEGHLTVEEADFMLENIKRMKNWQIT